MSSKEQPSLVQPHGVNTGSTPATPPSPTVIETVLDETIRRCKREGKPDQAIEAIEAALLDDPANGRLHWRWLARLKSNRRVNPGRAGLRAVSACDVAEAGTVVHLEGYGLVKVFRIGAKDGTADHWATDDLTMDDPGRLRLADASWGVEEYHRGLKQTTNVERCQCRVGRAQRGHIGPALRAFVVLERYCFGTGVNRLTAKRQILHEAIRAYRTNPHYRKLGTA